MMNVPIRSRYGNVALAIAGVLYILGAVGALVLMLRTTPAASSLRDWALIGALLLIAACGAWLVFVARTNLRMPRRARTI